VVLSAILGSSLGAIFNFNVFVGALGALAVSSIAVFLCHLVMAPVRMASEHEREIKSLRDKSAEARTPRLQIVHDPFCRMCAEDLSTTSRILRIGLRSAVPMENVSVAVELVPDMDQLGRWQLLAPTPPLQPTAIRLNASAEHLVHVNFILRDWRGPAPELWLKRLAGDLQIRDQSYRVRIVAHGNIPPEEYSDFAFMIDAQGRPILIPINA
jgi:hypothetical protein